MGWAPWPPQVDGQFATQVQQGFQAAQVANIVFVEPQQFDAQQEEAPPLTPLQSEHVEEVIINPAANGDQIFARVVANQQEQVLALDEFTDTDSEAEPQPVALPIPLVEIVSFPDFNNLQPMIPLPEDEI